MDQDLKEITVPFLRDKGIKGSLTHFRRQQADVIILLTFHPGLYDTKFVVEIANCPNHGITTHWGKEIPKNMVTAHDQPNRLRLGSEKFYTDYWFEYGKKHCLRTFIEREQKK